MKIEEITAEWKNDCKIDITDIQEGILKTPQLHCKYISILSNCKMMILKSERNYLGSRKKMTKYYNGEMDNIELSELGLDQYQHKRPLITQLENLLTIDERVIEYKMIIEELTICKDMLESIIKSIASRSYDMRALVDYMKWSQGIV